MQEYKKFDLAAERKFNLVDQRWIPCITLDGRYQEYSLREAFTHAWSISEIFDPSPPVVGGLHRLLLAILHRNFGPRDSRSWEEM